MKNKTAKDMAFDRERAKYGMQIKNLQNELSQKNRENLELRKQISNLELERDQLKDWINRLLEYTEMSEEDMKKAIQKDIDLAEAASMMTGLLKVARFGSYF
jgi:DNA repair exonuclease SbcCD ATPase subunit